MSLTVGSLCTGIGGLDLAVEAHFGAELAWYCEVEPAPCMVLEREWPGVPNLGDLTAVDWSKVTPVDIVTAGYPCPPFSVAGKRKGADDERHLWPYIAEAVRVLRPRRQVYENVAGHLTLGFGDVLGDLAEAGFDAEWCVLRASDVGAPHQRARLFIVARDADRARADPFAPGGTPREAAGERRGASADADGTGLEGRGALRRGRDERASRPRGLDVAWGPYEPAVRRWEALLGRAAPRPTDDRGRLNPPFVEWMLGYPEGWVDGLTRTQALKALGNSVCPQQATAALSVLAPVAEEVAA